MRKTTKEVRVRLKYKGQVYIDQTFPAGTPLDAIEEWKLRHKLKRIQGRVNIGCPTVVEYLDRFLALYETWKRREASTSKKQRRDLQLHVLPFFEDCRLDAIDTADIVDWQAALIEEGMNPNHIKNLRSHFSTMFKVAIVEKLVTFNPVAAVPCVARQDFKPDFWDADEADRFLCYAMEKNFEVFQVAAFALNTGMRPGEMRGLKRDCLNFDAGIVDIRRTWCTKTNSLKERTKTGVARKVSIAPEVWRVIANKRGLDDDDFVFPGLWNSWGWRYLRPMAQEAKVKPIRFHDLRHSFASQLVMAGRSLIEIKELLGHKKIDSTMIYAHLTDTYKTGLTDVLASGKRWASMARQAKVVSIG
jgi:integrase